MSRLLILALLAVPPAPAADLPAAGADCAAAAAERQALEEERGMLRRDLADIALGKTPKKKRKKLSGADVGRAAAGVAVGVLLPFPLSAAVNGAAGAIGGKKEKEPESDGPVPETVAMIDRGREIDARLAALAEACPAPPAADAPPR